MQFATKRCRSTYYIEETEDSLSKCCLHVITEKWTLAEDKFISNSCLSCLDHKQISPVLVAFEQELSRFIKYIKKKSEPGLKTKKNDEEPLARGYVHL